MAVYFFSIPKENIIQDVFYCKNFFIQRINTHTITKIQINKKGKMTDLKALQYTCMIVMIMLAFFVTTSHFFVVRKNRQYEQSRLMIVAALLILAIHYLLQMTFKFREQGDDVGALANILFYAPASILLS